MVGVSNGNSTRCSGTDEALLRAEFLAEDELIEINPSVRTSLITLVRGSYGPFEPSITTIVPLWLALALKKVQRCSLLPPPWLTASSVEQVVASERTNTEELQPLNFYFWEISTLLLAHASDDLDSPTDLRRALEDLSNTRSAKLRRWMHASVRDRVNAIKLNNLCMHEIELNRGVLTKVLDDLYSIHVPEDEATISGLNSSSTPSTSTPNTNAEVTPEPPRRTLRRVIRRT